eukprot:2038365-Prymnesium_polylepis.1
MDELQQLTPRGGNVAGAAGTAGPYTRTAQDAEGGLCGEDAYMRDASPSGIAEEPDGFHDADGRSFDPESGRTRGMSD